MRAQYTVKVIEGATLGWAVYRVATDAPDVRQLVALAVDERTAQRIARMLSGDDQVEDTSAEHEAADAALWAWRMGTD